jgi:PIN domain nuclease of toxin-antitoxin system
VKFITDTQAFLWFVTDSPRLSPQAKRLLESPDSERWLSVGSLWEIAIKTNLGKLTFDKPLQEFLPKQLALNQFRLLDVSVSHVLRVSVLPLHHRDPFDRMIVAQSLTETLPVVSNDTALDAYSIQRFW